MKIRGERRHKSSRARLTCAQIRRGVPLRPEACVCVCAATGGGNCCFILVQVLRCCEEHPQTGSWGGRMSLNADPTTGSDEGGIVGKRADVVADHVQEHCRKALKTDTGVPQSNCIFRTLKSIIILQCWTDLKNTELVGIHTRAVHAHRILPIVACQTSHLFTYH